jgi:hypothetical protein
MLVQWKPLDSYPKPFNFSSLLHTGISKLQYQPVLQSASRFSQVAFSHRFTNQHFVFPLCVTYIAHPIFITLIAVTKIYTFFNQINNIIFPTRPFCHAVTKKQVLVCPYELTIIMHLTTRLSATVLHFIQPLFIILS